MTSIGIFKNGIPSPVVFCGGANKEIFAMDGGNNNTDYIHITRSSSAWLNNGFCMLTSEQTGNVFDLTTDVTQLYISNGVWVYEKTWAAWPDVTCEIWSDTANYGAGYDYVFGFFGNLGPYDIGLKNDSTGSNACADFN